MTPELSVDELDELERHNEGRDGGPLMDEWNCNPMSMSQFRRLAAAARKGIEAEWEYGKPPWHGSNPGPNGEGLDYTPTPVEPTDIDGLVEGLRDPEYGIIGMPLIAEAADRIATLTKERDALREALVPFAEEAKEYCCDDRPHDDVVRPCIRAGHLQKARAALTPDHDQEGEPST